jgi:hypothetical protein
MASGVVGLWLNDVPDAILNDDHSLRELSEVILQGYRAQKMAVADNALLITMEKDNCLPQEFIGSVAQDLKGFLIKKRIPQAEMDAITLSSYDDADKWKSIKEQIIAAVDDRPLEGWDNKPLEEWGQEDIIQWLTDKNLRQYCQSFKENDIDGPNLLELNESDLRDLGIVSIGHRKVFMRHLNEAKNFKYPEDEPPEEYIGNFQDTTAQNDVREPEASPYKSVMVRGLPKSLLQDEDTLFDIENLVFSVYSMDTFEARADGILVTFESPITTKDCDDLKVKFMEVLKSLMMDGQLQGGLTIDLWENGKIVPRPGSEISVPKSTEFIRPVVEPEDEVKAPPPPPPTTNYFKEFWLKLTTNGDVEDFFDDEESRLNKRGAREVLATIRDVKLKEIKKDDPGIKHLNGFSQAEIQASFSDCLLEVMYEVEGKQPPKVEETPKQPAPGPGDAAGKGSYIGMSVEGLPRFITDDDKTVHSIQSSVFRDVQVRRLIVLDDQTPPALKVEFEKFITSDKIPQLARNLKNFLKAVNVDQKALNDVTIAFLEEEMDQPAEEAPATFTRPHGNRRPRGAGFHKRIETNDFLVAPGDTVEMTKTFMIEGIPEKYLNKDSFLRDMPEKVFEGVPLEGISVPPPTQQADGSMSQTSLEIQFKVAQNIQKLPKIAMKLKKFLKRKQIPPNVVNRVTLQVRHETPEPQTTGLDANPVVGLIFKGIPKNILESNESLYDMESDVFTGKHPIRLMEPNEADQMLRITIENPIRNQTDLTTIAQRLKRFLAKQGVGQQAINDVLVMSFSRDKWQFDAPGDSTSVANPNDYVGIELENMPASIVDSDKQLEEIERRVFSQQKVVHMNVLDTSLRITFGVAADSKGIEKVARELKRFLSSMKIPIKQINDIVIAPHTKDTWE